MAPTEVQLPPKNLNVQPLKAGDDTKAKLNEMIQRYDEVYRLLREYMENGLSDVNVISPIESNGGIPVNIQDQTTPPLDFYFIQANGAPSTLAAATAIDDTTISVTGNIISVGDYIGIFSGTSGEGRFYFGEALAVAGAGPYTITLDIPLDFAFDSGDPVISTTRELNVDGSTTSQSYNVTVGGPSGDVEVDITRIIISMICSSQPDDGLFGNLSELTNGIVLRRTNGDTRNIWDAKSNSDLAVLAYDVTYTQRTVPQGSWGVRCRYTLAGQDKHGVAVRLAVGDSLEMIVQDDLTGLTQFRVIAAGHIVTD